jgi:hypothetical protein
MTAGPPGFCGVRFWEQNGSRSCWTPILLATDASPSRARGIRWATVGEHVREACVPEILTHTAVDKASLLLSTARGFAYGCAPVARP